MVVSLLRWSYTAPFMLPNRVVLRGAIRPKLDWPSSRWLRRDQNISGLRSSQPSLCIVERFQWHDGLRLWYAMTGH